MSVADSSQPDHSRSAAVPIDIENLRMKLSSVIAATRAKVSIETLRPLPVFLGIRDAENGLRLSNSAFVAADVTFQNLPARIRSNAEFFLSNYVLCAAMVALVVSLMHVEMIFALASIYGLWMFHAYLIQHSIVILNVPIHAILTVQQRFYVLFCISAIAIVYVCMVPAVIWITISGIIILLHATLRNPNHRSLDISQRAADDEMATDDTTPLVTKV